MKLLFVSQFLPPEDYSGIPIITWNQLKTLSNLNNEVHCLTTTINKNKFFKSFTIDNIKIFYLPHAPLSFFNLKIHIKNYLLKLKSFIFIYKLLKKNQYNLIHINDYFSTVSDLTLKISKKFFKNIKIVREYWFYEEICFRQNLIISEKDKELCPGLINPHNCINCYFKTYSSSNKIKQTLKKILIPFLIKIFFKKFNNRLKKIDAIIFPDKDLKILYNSINNINLKKKNSIVIPHGIELQRSSKIIIYNNNTINFLFLGALYFRKGIDVIIDCLKMLINNKIEGYKFYIGGIVCEENYFTELNKLIKNNSEKIIYIGPYKPNDIKLIINKYNIHCGIVVSYVETYCRVLRELIINNVPVICTSFIGSNIIKDGYNGFKINIGFANELYECILKILNNPNIINQLSLGAYNTFILQPKDEGEMLFNFYKSITCNKIKNT